MMKLVFVHGWSVTSTTTYGKMPTAILQAAPSGMNLAIDHIYLGKYISFHDEVTLDDIARAFDAALRDLPGNENDIKAFSCVTHSTGGPVVRHWVDRYYGDKKLGSLPLKHLVMLAPANHGSALARLGKARVGRIKAWLYGVETGQRVLDWLSLGSKGGWDLNKNYLKYDSANKGFFSFVLTGLGIDHALLNYVDSYLGEAGSDGVVRAAGANMNYRFFSLVQGSEPIKSGSKTLRLIPKPLKKSKKTPLRIYPEYAHSGARIGIMAHKISAEPGEEPDKVVTDIISSLKVKNLDDYNQIEKYFKDKTNAEQPENSNFAMMVFSIHDDNGAPFAIDDFDLLLLSGTRYKPENMPSGFLKDKQVNTKTHNLVFYVDMNVMAKLDGHFGIKILARPDKGFAYFSAGEYHSDGLSIHDVIAANETTYIDIILKRQVDKNVFRLGTVQDPRKSFKDVKPAGVSVP